MDDSEVSDMLEELEQLLEELGLTSIVEQERTAAIEGRVVETTRADVPRPKTLGTPQPEVGDVRRVPLSERERLAILIDLVEVAAGGTFTIEERVLGFVEENFPTSTGETRRTSFRPDRAEGFVLEDDREWSLPDRRMLDERRGAVRQVLEDLGTLRELANLERSPALSVSRDFERNVSDRILGWA